MIRPAPRSVVEAFPQPGVDAPVVLAVRGELVRVGGLLVGVAPVLPARLAAGVDHRHRQPARGGGDRGGEAGGPGADDGEVRTGRRARLTSTPPGSRCAAACPAATGTRQARWSGPAVDLDEAVEADADPAEQAARPAAAPGRAPGPDARVGQGGADALPGPRASAGARRARRGRARRGVRFSGHRRAPGPGRPGRPASKRSGRNGCRSSSGVRPVRAWREQRARPDAEADAGALVPAGVPQPGRAGVGADDREVVGAVGPEAGVRADQRRVAQHREQRAPRRRRAGPAPGATGCGRSRPARGRRRPGRCRSACPRPRARSAAPRRSWPRRRRSSAP